MMYQNVYNWSWCITGGTQPVIIMCHGIWATSGSVLRSCPPRWCRHPLGGACHLWSLAPRRLAVAVRGSSCWNAALLRFPGQASLFIFRTLVDNFWMWSKPFGYCNFCMWSKPCLLPVLAGPGLQSFVPPGDLWPCLVYLQTFSGYLTFYKMGMPANKHQQKLSLFMFWSIVWAKDCILTGQEQACSNSQVKEPG